MTTVADLKALAWKFTAHADGSDKGGRFSINFYEAELDGEKVAGSKKQWRRGGGQSTYSFRGQTFHTLAELATFINSPAGDAPEARDD